MIYMISKEQAKAAVEHINAPSIAWRLRPK